MTGTTRRIGSVLVGPVLLIVATGTLVQAAEQAADATKSPPAASDKTGSPPAAYEDAESIPTPAGGCCGGPKLVPACRCVPTKKKKQKTEYEVKCELVCVPGCGKHLFGKQHSGWSGCCSDGAGGCDQPCCDHATIRNKKTLLKKVVDEEEDAWEYKVEWARATCAAGCCPAGCSSGVPSTPRRAWQAFHEFCRGLFHRK